MKTHLQIFTAVALFFLVSLGSNCGVTPNLDSSTPPYSPSPLSASDLHAAKVDWIDNTHIRATYDWSTDVQLQDWSPTTGATLTRANGTVTITGGATDVRAMRWVLPIAASRIRARANPVNCFNHINIYTNLATSWVGNPWNANPSIGVVHADWSAPNTEFWSLDGSTVSFPGTLLTANTWYDFELTISPTLIRSWSSVDKTWYQRSGTYVPRIDGTVALGAYGGQNAWGTVVIEGEVVAADTTAPVISAINSTPASTAASIQWTTNEPATSIIEYGTTTAYGSTSSSSTLTSAHSLALDHLLPDTVYQFRVKSADASGNTSTWANGSFTTAKSSPHPDLGLSASLVEWLDDAHVRVTYDWSNSKQLADWTPTAGANLSWSSSSVRVQGGGTDVHGMIWSFPIRASKVLAAANPLNSGHVNIYTNLSSSWTGTPYNPNPSYGHIWRTGTSLWSVDGAADSYSGAVLTANQSANFELDIASSVLSSRMSGASVHTRAGTYQPSAAGKVAIGAYGSDSQWGPVTIEGAIHIIPANIAVATREHSVDISWSTSIPETSTVEYGPNTSYGSTAGAQTLSTSHLVTLSGLSLNVPYHFRVSAKTATGQSVVSTDQTFTLSNDGVPEDEVAFETIGSAFSAVLTVASGASVRWTFADGTTSTSTRPTKNYGSLAKRLNRLKVTPWSALTAVNIGYDGADGGSLFSTENFSQQNVTRVIGMKNMAPSLVSWTSSNNPLTYLDFSNFVALQDIECAYCRQLTSTDLTNTPRLRRACFEDADLKSLDLSQSPALEDLRAALNSYTSINWGTTGSRVWHICTRDNPQMTQNMPNLSQFPNLVELFVWQDNQHGELHPTSQKLVSVLAVGNHYSSANLSGCFGAGRDARVEISENELTSLDVSNDPGLLYLDANHNLLRSAQIDSVLQQLDANGASGGYLDLTKNSAPSSEGRKHATNLTNRQWTVKLDSN